MKFSFLTALLLITCQGFSQTNPVGIFENHTDIGNPKNAGTTKYDAEAQVYNLRGSGFNIWFNRDEFQYAYKKINGDFILTGNFEFIGDKGNGHRKIGWMVRESTDEGAASMNAVTHGDGLVVLQWREMRGAFMRDPQDEIFFPKKNLQVIQLERIAQKFIMRVAHPGEPLQEVGSHNMTDMPDSVIAGIYICSHDSDKVEEAVVWNVRIDKPAPNDYSPNPQIQRTLPRTQAVLGCRLETINVSNGKRKIVYESTGKFEAPNWMLDGKNLMFNEGGSLYKISTKGGTPQKINTSVGKNKSGYVDSSESSPDGKYVYYHTNATGTMQIWRMRANGSNKDQLTYDEYNNWFPHISPDGKWVAFISFPFDIDPNNYPSHKKAMLRVMPVGGGAPRVIAYLYGGEGTININPWSPDSKSLAFVSNSE